MKKSYHSSAVPVSDAATTRLSALEGFWPGAAEGRGSDMAVDAVDMIWLSLLWFRPSRPRRRQRAGGGQRHQLGGGPEPGRRVGSVLIRCRGPGHVLSLRPPFRHTEQYLASRNRYPDFRETNRMPSAADVGAVAAAPTPEAWAVAAAPRARGGGGDGRPLAPGRLKANGSCGQLPADRRLAPRRLDRTPARPAHPRRVALHRGRRLRRHLQRPAVLQPRLALATARRQPLRPRRRGTYGPWHPQAARRRRHRR